MSNRPYGRKTLYVSSDDLELWHRATVQAERQGISLSEYVREALARYVAATERQPTGAK